MLTSRPPLAADHAGQEGPAGIDGGMQVDGQHPVVISLAHLQEGLVRTDRRVVDDDIDDAESGESLCCHGLDGGAVADIAHADHGLHPLGPDG